MKRIIILIGMCLISVGLMQAETLLVPALEIGAGEQASLTIELENKTMTPTAWQMALSLPEGVTIAERNGGGYECELSSRHDASHSLTVVRQGDRRYVLICYSSNNTAISGQGGGLVSIKVEADTKVKGKTLKGTVANAVISDANGVKAHLAEAEFQLGIVFPVIHIASVSRQYGDQNPSFTYTVTGATLRGTPNLTTTASASSPVGKYSISAERGSVQNAYYEVEDGALTVTKASLTISAGTYTKKQGEAMPEFTLTYDGFKNSETKSVLTKQAVVTCEATAASAPGQYPVVVSGAAAQNYDISYTNGVLIVSEADLVVIRAKSYTREYGNSNPVFEYECEGAALDGQPEIYCSATPTSPVGSYHIVVNKGTVKNPNVQFVNGLLTVTKASLTISAGTYTKKQGEAMPEFTLTYDGFKNNETKSVLTKQAVVSCEATAASAPGQYPVVVSGATAQNYDISYTNGVLMVAEADPVIIRAKSYTREYGDPNPAFEYEHEGAALDGQPEISCFATPTSPVNTYDIVVKMGTVKNYNVQLVNGTLTVNPAVLTVKAVDATMEAGNEVPSLSVEYSGWKNGEDESVLTAKPVASTTATKESVVGTYPITVSGGEAQNYSFTYVEGVLTVTEPSVIKEILASGKPFNIYNTMGMLVRHQVTTLSDLPTGIYIINGQKVAVK